MVAEQAKIAVGSKVSWTKLYGGIRLRYTGYVKDIIGRRCLVSVVRSTPVEDTGEPMGITTYYDPPVRRHTALETLVREANADENE